GGARSHARAHPPHHSRLSARDREAPGRARAHRAHPGGRRRPRRLARRLRDLAHPGSAAAHRRREEARGAAPWSHLPVVALQTGEAPSGRWRRIGRVTAFVTAARAERHFVTLDTFANGAGPE